MTGGLTTLKSNKCPGENFLGLRGSSPVLKGKIDPPCGKETAPPLRFLTCGLDHCPLKYTKVQDASMKGSMTKVYSLIYESDLLLIYSSVLNNTLLLIIFRAEIKSEVRAQ